MSETTENKNLELKLEDEPEKEPEKIGRAHV